jgi:hypothetical protein
MSICAAGRSPAWCADKNKRSFVTGYQWSFEGAVLKRKRAMTIYRKIEYSIHGLDDWRWKEAYSEGKAERARFAGCKVGEDKAIAVCRASIDGWLDGRVITNGQKYPRRLMITTRVTF